MTAITPRAPIADPARNVPADRCRSCSRVALVLARLRVGRSTRRGSRRTSATRSSTCTLARAHRGRARLRAVVLDRAHRVPSDRRIPAGSPGSCGWRSTSGSHAHEPLLIGLVQALLGTASVALVYAITARLFGHRVALIAAAITACFPNLVFYSALDVLGDALPVRRAARGLARSCAPTGDPRRRPPCWCAFGLVVGLSSLVRPFALLALLALARRRAARRRRSARDARARSGSRPGSRCSCSSRGRSATRSRSTRSCRSRRTSATRCASTTARAPTAASGPCLRPARRSRPEGATQLGDRAGSTSRSENSHNLHVRGQLGGPPSRARGGRSCSGARTTATATTTTASPIRPGAHGNFPPRGLRGPLGRLADVVLLRRARARAARAASSFARDPRRLFVLLVGASIAVGAAVPLRPGPLPHTAAAVPRDRRGGDASTRLCPRRPASPRQSA